MQEQSGAARVQSGAHSLNNFDLLRLFAASSVMLLHLCDHLGYDVSTLRVFLDPFPGVPIFFVISGYLISKSWQRYPLWRQYALNRVLRIFPALWVALAVSLTTVFAAGFVIDADPLKIWLWVAAQVSFAQFVTPSFFEGFGTGILNGSLWTIPVELQFYCVLPLLLAWRPLIWSAGVVSIGACVLLVDKSMALPGGIVLPWQATLLPNLYMFAIGVLLARHFEALRRILVGCAHWWLLAYIFAFVFARRFDVTVGTNHPNAAVMLLLAFLVISVAYTLPSLSTRLLRGNDLSYGIYIYHMVVANYLLEVEVPSLWLAIASTLLLAAASWWCVERPALALKNVSLNRATPAT